MRKMLAKTYDPQGIEDRIYKNWEDKKPLKDSFHDRHPPAEYHGTAPYGTRPGQYDAGYPDPLEAHAGI